MSTRTIKGELEIDSERGVIYFHTNDEAEVEKCGTVSILRICRLPTPIPDDQQLDITMGHGVNWESTPWDDQNEDSRAFDFGGDDE